MMEMVLRVGLFLCWIFVNEATCVGNISSSEFQALQSLFASTHGLGWLWNISLPVSTQWHFHNSTINLDLHHPCGDTWQGLQCSFAPNPLSLTSACTIQNMTLVNMNLVGSLPASISLLSNLEELVLQSNLLSGNLPSQFESLVHLQVAHFHENKFCCIEKYCIWGEGGREGG